MYPTSLDVTFPKINNLVGQVLSQSLKRSSWIRSVDSSSCKLHYFSILTTGLYTFLHPSFHLLSPLHSLTLTLNPFRTTLPSEIGKGRDITSTITIYSRQFILYNANHCTASLSLSYQLLLYEIVMSNIENISSSLFSSSSFATAAAVLHFNISLLISTRYIQATGKTLVLCMTGLFVQRHRVPPGLGPDESLQHRCVPLPSCRLSAKAQSKVTAKQMNK